MNDRKKILIGAAVSGILSVGLVSGAYAKANTADKPADDTTKGKCVGPNSCGTAGHKCGAGKCGNKNFEMMTKAECDKKGNKYRFEEVAPAKPAAPAKPTAPNKQNKAENNADNTQAEQEADANVTDNADGFPTRDPHE